MFINGKGNDYAYEGQDQGGESCIISLVNKPILKSFEQWYFFIISYLLPYPDHITLDTILYFPARRYILTEMNCKGLPESSKAFFSIDSHIHSNHSIISIQKLLTINIFVNC